MKREIKFRVWKPLEKVMYSHDWLHAAMVSYNALFDVSRTDFVVMQYTGINDKTNREIYEGDIVRVLSGGLNHWVGEKFRVHYCEDTAKFNITNDKSYPHDIDDGISYKYLEVIGNIYQNPELVSSSEIPTEK